MRRRPARPEARLPACSSEAERESGHESHPMSGPAMGSSVGIGLRNNTTTDPKLALQIYAHVMRRDPGQIERLRSLVHGGREAATAPEVALTTL